MNASDTADPECTIQQAQLGDHRDDHELLASRLEAIVKRVNADSEGSWKAKEWLSIVTSPCKWVASKLSDGAVWAFRRLASYNERQANAEKTRKQGKAILVRAEAEAKLLTAKARTEEAKARTLEIKNEATGELLKQMKDRGIDFAAAITDSSVHIAVVKADGVVSDKDEAELKRLTNPKKFRKIKEALKRNDSLGVSLASHDLSHEQIPDIKRQAPRKPKKRKKRKPPEKRE